MGLRIGLLNMMPDKALAVTERQFATLLGRESGRNLELLRFSFFEMTRGPAARAYLQEHYRDISEMRAEDLDVLVISGANVSNPDLTTQDFWGSLTGLLDWALAADVPTLCSCLATHAVLAYRHGQRRYPVAPKVWGVYPHRPAAPNHPVLIGLPAVIPVPHSRHNEVSAPQFAAAGYEVLLASDEAGVHLAVERERGRWLLLQGHPEYEAVSLLKEYKREVLRWQGGERPDYPSLPSAYMGGEAVARLAEYREVCSRTRLGGTAPPPFPEQQVVPHIRNTWTAAAVRIVSNWLATVDRKKGSR